MSAGLALRQVRNSIKSLRERQTFCLPTLCVTNRPRWICDLAGRKGWGTHILVGRKIPRHWSLLADVQVPAVLFHLGTQPALQAGAQRGWDFSKLNSVLPAFVGPGNASREFRGSRSVAAGNRKDKRNRSA